MNTVATMMTFILLSPCTVTAVVAISRGHRNSCWPLRLGREQVRGTADVPPCVHWGPDGESSRPRHSPWNWCCRTERAGHGEHAALSAVGMLPHLSSTAKARSGEWDPMQPKGPVQGALQQRLPLPPGQQPTLPLRESPFPPGALPCANLPINGMFEQTLHLCVSVHHFIRESGLRVLTAQLPQSQRAFCRRADAVGSGFTDSVTKAPPPVRAPALGQSE